MTDMVWADPPNTRRTKWAAVATELKSHPGKWAKVKAHTKDGSLSTRIKRGQSAFTPAGAFESRNVSLSDGYTDVYARYVGDE